MGGESEIVGVGDTSKPIRNAPYCNVWTGWDAATRRACGIAHPKLHRVDRQRVNRDKIPPIIVPSLIASQHHPVDAEQAWEGRRIKIVVNMCTICSSMDGTSEGNATNLGRGLARSGD